MIILASIMLLVCFIPPLYRNYRKEARRRLLSQQLQQTLAQMAHALRIGVGLQQAFRYAAEEGAPPLSEEWNRLLRRVALGVSWSEAWEELPARVPIPAMKWFVVALEITRQTGGGLADVLESLAESLRERQTLWEKVSALTAPGQASGMVLAALPFVILGVLQLLVPELTRPLFTTRIGQSMLAGVLISVALGGWMIWRMVRIRVEP